MLKEWYPQKSHSGLKSTTMPSATSAVCLGVLNFTKKYSRQALEECCKQALSLNKATYTFIKNSIPVVAEDIIMNDEVSANAIIKRATRHYTIVINTKVTC